MPNKSWFKNRLKDSFFLKAKKENYRSRAAYKLTEILQKYKMVKPGSSLLDVGAAPGSWTQVLTEIAGPRGRIVSVDLLEIVPIEGSHIIQGDIRDPAIQEMIGKLCPNRFDTIFSDMAPNTTGVHHADTGNSVDLVNLVLDLSKIWLKPNGNFVAKVFEGGEYKELHSKAKSLFTFAKSFKPTASLSESREIFLVCQGYKN